MERERDCAAATLPAGMAATVAGYAWARDQVGESGGAVYRLHGRADASDLYLKHGTGPVADAVTDEMVRLDWLARYVPVPALRHFTRTRDEAWLLITALGGQTAYQVMAADIAVRPAIVDALAAFLQRLHAISPEQCPFNADAAYRLAQARAHVDAGLVDEEDFDDDREGWTAEQVWEAANGLLPLLSDRVVTHGDFSLDNMLIVDGAVVGCIDVGRVGIADRYQDLAILWNCLDEFGPELQARLLERYGEGTGDRARLEFHLLLDELF